MKTLEKIEIVGTVTDEFAKILTSDALSFISELHYEFNGQREELLKKRAQRQAQLDKGNFPDFLPETKSVREGVWTVAPTPKDLLDRRVEITGPVEQKMMINALNSGAQVFMADLEDALTPSWTNVIQGQINLKEAVRRTLTFQSPEGKSYKLKEELATLVVRPRGWHLVEKHVLIEGKPVSASLFDFGLYFFHNAEETIARKTGPYFYLPKMESHLEARLWNDVFNFAESKLKLPGTIRATVLIETILAAFEMDEILYELKDHAAGLNAGRWDYIFSMIKKLSNHKQFLLPDRSQITMQVPFMRAYAQLMVKTCHKRSAHAMGGMAAFIPSRKDEKINEIAFAKVREDKELEATSGFDGTWVAHPDLVVVAREQFDKVLGSNPHQRSKQRDDVVANAEILLDVKIDGGKITQTGLLSNIDVALQYIESWLRGTGAAAIHNLMEDAATAEISRAQIWQWINREAKLDDGTPITLELYKALKEKQLAKLITPGKGRYAEAAEILDGLVESKHFPEFLTTAAYEYLKER